MESLLPEERFEVREPSTLARVGGYVLWTMVMLVCYAAALVAVAKP